MTDLVTNRRSRRDPVNNLYVQDSRVGVEEVVFETRPRVVRQDWLGGPLTLRPIPGSSD